MRILIFCFLFASACGNADTGICFQAPPEATGGALSAAGGTPSGGGGDGGTTGAAGRPAGTGGARAGGTGGAPETGGAPLLLDAGTGGYMSPDGGPIDPVLACRILAAEWCCGPLEADGLIHSVSACPPCAEGECCVDQGTNPHKGTCGCLHQMGPGFLCY
jgi:hypothetical protein